MGWRGCLTTTALRQAPLQHKGMLQPPEPDRRKGSNIINLAGTEMAHNEKCSTELRTAERLRPSQLDRGVPPQI
jgi:hypothetical protein